MNILTIDNTNDRREIVCLEDQDYEKAASYSSDSVTGEAQQWLTYLNVLALFGFEKWIREKPLYIVINSNEASIFKPKFAELIDAVCNVQIGDFKICLLTIDCFDDVIYLPEEAFKSPKLAGHFYVLTEVREEEGELIIRGMVNRNQLDKNINQFNLTVNDEGMYEIPFQWFEEDAVNILHYCGVLKPEAIALPQSSNIVPFTRTELREFLSNLQSKAENMWQNLSWEQKALALEYPKLFNLDLSKIPQHILESWDNLLTYISNQNVINLGLWFNNQIDNIASQSGWTFPRTPVFNGGAGVNDFQPVIRELKQIGQKIYCSTRKKKIGNLPLEIMIGLLPQQDSVGLKEPDFLLILRHERGAFLPEGLKLEVWNQNKTNCLSRLTLQNKELFLVNYVKIQPDEEFTITITFNNEVIDLDSFIFAF